MGWDRSQGFLWNIIIYVGSPVGIHTEMLHVSWKVGIRQMSVLQTVNPQMRRATGKKVANPSVRLDVPTEHPRRAHV